VCYLWSRPPPPVQLTQFKSGVGATVVIGRQQNATGRHRGGASTVTLRGLPMQLLSSLQPLRLHAPAAMPGPSLGRNAGGHGRQTVGSVTVEPGMPWAAAECAELLSVRLGRRLGRRQVSPLPRGGQGEQRQAAGSGTKDVRKRAPRAPINWGKPPKPITGVCSSGFWRGGLECENFTLCWRRRNRGCAGSPAGHPWPARSHR
jgi:hypothetical protein